MDDDPVVITAPEPLGADATLVAIRGEVTFANSEELRHALDDGLAADRRRLIVDISAVPFMDSSAISALLAASVQAGRQGRSMAIVHAGDDVPGIFRFRGVERLVRLFPSRAAAIEDA